jgi:hypothetical protein
MNLKPLKEPGHQKAPTIMIPSCSRDVCKGSLYTNSEAHLTTFFKDTGSAEVGVLPLQGRGGRNGEFKGKGGY